MKTETIDTLMDLSEIVEVLSDFANLGAEKLVEEINATSREINEMKEQIVLKAEVFHELDNKLKELRASVEELNENSENLEIELIRAKTRQKKVQKCIGKLKSLDASSVKLEVRGNDKLKMSKNKTKLDLTSSLLKVFVNVEDKGFIMNARDHQLKAVQLNHNSSNQVNREILWKVIGQQSQYTNEWQQLL